MLTIIKKHPRLFALGLVAHLLAVIFSEGYHRPDEHLGVIRMMSFKLGTFPLELLSWEYPARIRPFLQSALQFLMAKSYFSLGLSNPFHLAFLFRFFSATLALLAMASFIGLFYEKLRSKVSRCLFVGSSLLLSYFPFFHARATAENLSASFFMGALFFFLSKNHKNYFFVGLLFGASYILRFHMGIMVFFFFLWALIIDRLKLLNLLKIFSGLFLFIGLSTCIDYWGYGEWAFTSWNYFYQNIILKKASGFGVAPWYYYFSKVFLKGLPPLSLIFIGLYLWIWVKHPKHWVSWISLPFLLIHSLVGHKELRFIFALGAFLPLLLGLFFDQYHKKLFDSDKGALFPIVFKYSWMKIIFYIALFQNAFFLLISSLKPAYTPINFYKHLYHKEEVIAEIFTLGVVRDPLFFYMKTPLKFTPISDRKKITTLLKKSHRWFLADRFSDVLWLKENKFCHQDYLSYPEWIFPFKKYMQKSKMWGLFKCSI